MQWTACIAIGHPGHRVASHAEVGHSIAIGHVSRLFSGAVSALTKTIKGRPVLTETVQVNRQLRGFLFVQKRGQEPISRNTFALFCHDVWCRHINCDSYVYFNTDTRQRSQTSHKLLGSRHIFKVISC